MKKVLVIVICVLGLVSLASCRSTSKPCGLSENTTPDDMSNQDSDEMMFV